MAPIRKKNIPKRRGDFSPSPLFSTKAREWLRSYIIFAVAKSPDEQTPWASITIILPANLKGKIIFRLKIIRAMWTTEEYAIKIFMSLTQRHKTPRVPPPTRATELNQKK